MSKRWRLRITDLKPFQIAFKLFGKQLNDLTENEWTAVLGVRYPYQDPDTIRTWAKERCEKNK